MRYIVNMLGGDGTATSRTTTLNFYTDTTIKGITIPVNLSDDTSYTKNTTVTITIGDYSIRESFDYEKAETGERKLDISIGYSVSANTTITITISGSGVYLSCSSKNNYALSGQIVVVNGSIEATLDVDTTVVWEMSSANNGYPYIFEPDESIFEGYQPPKPLNSWKKDLNNLGYPWTWGFTEIKDGQNIYFTTTSGIIPLTAYYKEENAIIPLIFIKQT